MFAIWKVCCGGVLGDALGIGLSSLSSGDFARLPVLFNEPFETCLGSDVVRGVGFVRIKPSKLYCGDRALRA